MYDGFNGEINAHHQSGAGLLAIMLILLSVFAGLLVHTLSTNIILVAREFRTEAALNQAREALIGYAVSYPDKINPDYGPGYLPCPDRNNDGATDSGACSLSGHTSIGRFPYKTLELERLRDGQGETLWYVIADNFRNNPKLEPLNSDITGNLIVDTMDDIVAVVFAPGEPLLTQDRNTAPDAIGNYLENENADFDTEFVAHYGGDGNDRLAFVTRKELMQAVEKRVLAEIVRRFRQYQIKYHAFPWLSPYQNPVTSTFHAQMDAGFTPKIGWQGHVAFHPFHWASKPSKMSGSNPYLTDIHWNWENIVNATITGAGTVDVSCVVNLDCATGPFQNISNIASTAPVQCIWSEKNAVECDPVSVSLSVSYNHPSAAGCASGILERTYMINFPPYSGTATIQDPTATTYRTRDVVLNGAIPVRSDALQITDVYSGPISTDCNQDTMVIGTGSIGFTTGTTGILRASNIHYDLDIKTGEMPEWFFKNDWHTQVYIAYAEAEALPGSNSNVCIVADNCLILNGAGNPEHRSRALAIIAGHVLDGESRPSSQLAAYFESVNSILDEIFEKGVATLTFNDQAMVIATP